jgi:hypothetical protein
MPYIHYVGFDISTTKFYTSTVIYMYSVISTFLKNYLMMAYVGRIVLSRIMKTFVRIEVFTAVTMKNAVLWDVAPRRWRRYVPPKRRFTQELHSTTSQKTAFFNENICLCDGNRPRPPFFPLNTTNRMQHCKRVSYVLSAITTSYCRDKYNNV